MGNEIELYSKLQNPVAEIRELGKMVARSGMFGCEREEAGCAIVMMSWMDRMTLTQWSRTYDLVEGKARKKALAALAEFRVQHHGIQAHRLADFIHPRHRLRDARPGVRTLRTAGDADQCEPHP